MHQVYTASVIAVLALTLGGCGGGGGTIAAASSGQDATATTAVTTTSSATTQGTSVHAAATSSADSVTRVFSPTSFWYQPIPANATLNTNSAAYAQNLVNQIKTYYGTVNLNTNDYAAPIYFVRTSGGSKAVTVQDGMPVYPVAKTVNVGFNDCQNKGWTDPNLIAQWQNVPMPAGAVPAGGTDQEMSIYDLSTQTLWEFWVTSQVNGQWQACWGGRIQNTANNAGLFANPYGTTATGLPFIGGEISAQELASGQINHVMGISLVDVAAWNIFSWPATRSDGYNPNNAANRIPEGTRMRLDPGVNVDALNLTPVGKIIARAAQKYGFVVWDKAGSVSLRMVNPATYTQAGQSDPYPALFGGLASWQVMQNFPWDKMQFMPNNYGKS
ncbi:DUF4124 domain-containing protein [Thiomonas intermedia]|uniref:DUF4124 domain-containing protein n=1 Tax=Thiomonas intermedia TaxID=926 RepID=UPI0009A5016F|nr:DUF4124 domain-containing protein [Thiomonas intermedia]